MKIMDTADVFVINEFIHTLSLQKNSHLFVSCMINSIVNRTSYLGNTVIFLQGHNLDTMLDTIYRLIMTRYYLIWWVIASLKRALIDTFWAGICRLGCIRTSRDWTRAHREDAVLQFIQATHHRYVHLEYLRKKTFNLSNLFVKSKAYELSDKVSIVLERQRKLSKGWKFKTERQNTLHVFVSYTDVHDCQKTTSLKENESAGAS